MENTDERSSVKCKTHPDAPHGFLRDASHSAGRYVCECESWEPPSREWVGLTDEESVSLLVKANKPKVTGQQFTTAPEMAAEFGRLVSELLKERNT